MKKVVLAILATVAIGATLTVPLKTDARQIALSCQGGEVGFRNLKPVYYEVMFRHSRKERWQPHAYFNSRFNAEKAAACMRFQGYQAYVERQTTR